MTCIIHGYFEGWCELCHSDSAEHSVEESGLELEDDE